MCPILKTLAGFLFAVGLPLLASAQGPAETLPDYAPLLPKIQAMATPVDPERGYAVKVLKPGIYMMTDGAYESVFVTTGEGVVLVDAPPSFAQHIVQAVQQTTNEPIVELVYSHEHVDHIGGASLILKQVPQLKILAEGGTAEFLGEMRDPNRPAPTQTFKDQYTLKLGSLTANMKVEHWHTPTGDLIIDIPDRRCVIAVDAFSSGATPFMGFDLTTKVHDYLKIFDQLSRMDWDVLVAGHHSAPATREDLSVAKSYVLDVCGTMARILAENHQPLIARAVNKYGRENKWAVSSVLITSEVNQCADEIKNRWITKLEGVDIWAASHCSTALVYDQWDVGSRKPLALATTKKENGSYQFSRAARTITPTSYAPEPK